MRNFLVSIPNWKGKDFLNYVRNDICNLVSIPNGKGKDRYIHRV